MDRSQPRGFRQEPGKVADIRNARREQERRITALEFATNMKEVQAGFQKLGRHINDRTIRIEALVKTLVNAGVITEQAYLSNAQNMKRVQSFVQTIMDNEQMPDLQKIRAVVKFNEGQPADFKVTDAYFPVRNYLVMNEDDLSLDEIAEIALAFGFPESEVDKIMADVKTVEAQKQEQKNGEAGPGR